jgi:hypothetical protein
MKYLLKLIETLQHLTTPPFINKGRNRSVKQ